jgi:hypothetical protein
MEECCVCGELTAEYACDRCEELVCEDCTVAMTYHNQVDYTCCSNCRPDDETQGQINKRKKPKKKTMERLTELKVGLQLEADVLEAWCRPEQGKNLSHESGTPWRSSTNVYGSSRPQPITEIPSGSDYFRIKNSDLGSLLFKKAGFIEFYNQFYKLGTFTARTNFDGCRVAIGNLEESTAVQTKLFELGYKWCSAGKSLQTYTNDTFFISPDEAIFRGDSSFIEKAYTLISIADILGSPAAKSIRPKLDLSNLSDVYFEVPDKETQDKLLTKLFELGYTLNREKELWTSTLEYWKIEGNKYISGNIDSYNVELLDYNLILDSKTLNNNYTLNNKTDGKTIIVRKPYPTVSRGERPKGNRLSGKTSRTAITSRPIRHRTIRG